MTNKKYKFWIILLVFTLLGLIPIFAPKKSEPNYVVLKTYKTRSIIQFKINSMEIDNVLLPYALEFYDEAIRRGINVDSMSANFYGIFVDRTPIREYGITVLDTTITKNRQFCIVDIGTIIYINRMRLITFHELGHIYGFEHCHVMCVSIMSGKITSISFYNDWEEQKKIMFNREDHEEYHRIY